MELKSITFILVGDGMHRRSLLKTPLLDNRTYIVDLPLDIIMRFNQAHMEIITSEDEKEP